MESYLRGVVPAEVSPSLWPQEAMRAQAVAARTYAAYERAHAGSRAYDLCDTAACQAYGGASA
jgi:SpoIID/LytB domain protein